MPISAAEAARRLVEYQSPTINEAHGYIDEVQQILSIEPGSRYGTKLQIAAARAVKMISILTRGAAMKKLVGKLRPVAEVAAKVTLNLPYQTGETRLPFRSSLLKDTQYLAYGKVLIACNQMKRHYDQPVEWYAEWCAYIEGNLYLDDMDLVLSVAIDSGNDAVFNTLVQSMEGKHPIGAPSAVGIRALLRCKRQDAWPVVEKMLLQAERQEGLRQKIVECADELSPDTYKKVLKAIVEHIMFRFSSVIRAFLMWFPGLIDEQKPASAEKVVMRLIEFMDDPRLEPQRTYSDVYLRLWADAYFEASDAIQRAESYASDGDVEVRSAASALVSKVALSTAYPLVQRFLTDESVKVAAPAIGFISAHVYGNEKEFGKAFHDPVLYAARRWPKDANAGDGTDRKQVWDLAFNLSPTSMLAFYCDNLGELSALGRHQLASKLKKTSDAALARRMFIKFTSDGSSSVRDIAFSSLRSVKLETGELSEIEALLTRKSADLRSSVIKLLSNQAQDRLEVSTDRLLASGDVNQKKAGEELAKELAKKGVKKYAGIGALPDGQESVGDLNPSDLFGLLKADDLTWAMKPDPIQGLQLFTKEAVNLIAAIDAYIHERRDEMAAPSNRYGNEMVLVSELYAELIVPWTTADGAERSELSPFIAELLKWLTATMPGEALDAGTVLRARIICECTPYNSQGIYPDKLREIKKHFDPVPCYMSSVKGIVSMLAKRTGFDIDKLLNLLQDEIARETDGKYGYEGKIRGLNEKSWRTRDLLKLLMGLMVDAILLPACKLSEAQLKRVYALLRFVDEPLGRSVKDEVEKLWEQEQADAHEFIFFEMERSAKYSKVPTRLPIHPDIMDRIYGAGVCTESDYLYQVASQIDHVTKRESKLSPPARSAARKLVDRIIEVEVCRGEMPGSATNYARDIRGLVHLPQVVRVLKTGIELSRVSVYTYGNMSRPKSFSSLLKHSRPGPNETAEVCAARFNELKLNPTRLLELALLAPHWAAAVELALGWPCLEDAAWWLHAHTKDTSYRTKEEIDTWYSAFAERTPLSAGQLENGACDSAWFHRFRSRLTDKQWKQLDKVAKFASDGTGHARAQLYAKALQSQLTAQEIVDNIQSKRNPNYVRALGLLPLGDNPGHEVRERYAVLQEFLAGSRQFGSQRRETEKLAFEVALENLAAVAGYPDALRLTWSLEASEVEDMKDGIAATDGDVTVRLAFNELGSPEIAVEKAEKPLKEIPASLKKLPAIKALTERRTQLKKQLVRMRAALEQAMQRGDTFTASELQGLLEHPGLRPLLQSLVFVSESGLADFPSAGSLLFGEKGLLRIAHPYDLLHRGDWPDWQRRVFLEEWIQPFKQVFRELYTLTESEKKQDRVTRYGGHQVQPGRAIGILQKRGWIARYEEGVTKTNHKLGITAHLLADINLYTPADIEGVELESIVFTKSGDEKPIPLSEIPPVLFSETMRDLDLVVSVASSTGFDPEASESTIEMRQHVVEQTASLLRLDNVCFLERHVAITGKLAEYRVHMGSSVVHQLAKGELVIVAVRQPQRGRLFLPFVDDDPRTAELVSKVILLARDDEIKDPSILGQIIG